MLVVAQLFQLEHERFAQRRTPRNGAVARPPSNYPARRARVDELLWHSDGGALFYVEGSEPVVAVVAMRGGQTCERIQSSGTSTCTGCNLARSEERRVGKECRSRWAPYH